VKIGNTYHMYAAEIANHCGLNTWGQNSIIVHATSNTPEGPFTRQDQVMNYFSHNPTVLIAPDNTILIYHIGNGGGGTNPQKCTNGSTPSSFLTPTPHVQGAGDFNVLYSNSPNGPWQSLGNLGSRCDGSTTVQGYFCDSTDNPAPFVNPDGSVFVLKRSWNTAVPLNSLIGVAKATSFKGPYIHSHNPIFLDQNEDPFVYRNKRGYHALFHGMKPYDQSIYAGRHAFSMDGTNWTFTPIPAYNSTVVAVDGSSHTYSRRERPHLLIENGEPTHLYTGVQVDGRTDYVFTHVQPIQT